MVEDTKIDFGKACKVIADRQSTNEQICAAKAQIASLAELGHRDALRMVAREPMDYEIDLIKAVDSIPDREERGELYKTIANQYMCVNRRLFNDYCKKALENGSIPYLMDLKPSEAIPLLDKLDPKDYPIHEVADVGRLYAKAGFYENKWVEHLISAAEERPASVFNDKLGIVFFYGHLNESQAQKMERIIVNYVSEDVLQKSSPDVLMNFYRFAEEYCVHDLEQTVGIALLSAGDNCYLRSKSLAEDLINYSMEVKDPELFSRLMEVCSEEEIYSGLSENHSLSKTVSQHFARLASE